MTTISEAELRYWVARHVKTQQPGTSGEFMNAKLSYANAAAAFLEMKLYQLEEEERRGKEAMEAAIKSWGETAPCCNNDKTDRCICYDDYECKTCVAKEAESK